MSGLFSVLEGLVMGFENGRRRGDGGVKRLRIWVEWVSLQFDYDAMDLASYSAWSMWPPKDRGQLDR